MSRARPDLWGRRRATGGATRTSGREAEHVRFTTGRFPTKAPCGTPRCGVFVSLSPAAGDGGPSKATAHVTKTHVVFRFALRRRKRRVVPRTVVDGLLGTPRCRATLDFLLLQQAPHRLFQQQTRPDRLRGASPRQEGPSNRVATRHSRLRPEPCFALVRGHFNADRGGSTISTRTNTHHLLPSIQDLIWPSLKCGYTGMLANRNLLSLTPGQQGCYAT